MDIKERMEREMGEVGGEGNHSARGDGQSTELVVHSATVGMQTAAAAAERDKKRLMEELVVVKKQEKETAFKLKEAMDLNVVTESEKNEVRNFQPTLNDIIYRFAPTFDTSVFNIVYFSVNIFLAGVNH